MESILLVVHVVIALAIIGLIMLQQGKGAEMGASFGGGSSQTVFGAAGSGNFFSRMTGVLVAVFFATSVVLAVLSKEGSDLDELEVPVLEAVSEVVSDVPVATDDDSVTADDLPQSVEAVEEVDAADIPAAE